MSKLLQKNVFSWEHFCLYLSGPIDFDRDGGKDWRDEWTAKLCELGFRTKQIFNPCRKPLKNAPFNLDDESAIMKKHRSNREWNKLCSIMSQIAHIDLRMCDKSDLILVNMPLYCQDKALLNYLEKYAPYNFLEPLSNLRIQTYGTIHEIVVARQQKKPVMMVWPGGKKTCSAWLMWLIGHQNVFASFAELCTRLRNISRGKTSIDAREWLLLDLGETK